MAERENDLTAKGQMYAKLMETLSEHGTQVSVFDALSVLRRIENELSEIALKTAETKTAAAYYTVDAHGKVIERK